MDRSDELPSLTFSFFMLLRPKHLEKITKSDIKNQKLSGDHCHAKFERVDVTMLYDTHVNQQYIAHRIGLNDDWSKVQLFL